VGIDQLSYSAARHRNTTSSDSAISIGAWLPDSVLQRQAGPPGRAGGQLRDQALDLGHGFARAVARRRFAGDRHRRVAVVAGQLHRAALPVGCDEAPRAPSCRLLRTWIFSRSSTWLRWSPRPAPPPAACGPGWEVVDVAGAHRRVEHLADGGERHAQRVGLAAVHFQRTCGLSARLRAR
jgi:hypothetical protein